MPLKLKFKYSKNSVISDLEMLELLKTQLVENLSLLRGKVESKFSIFLNTVKMSNQLSFLLKVLRAVAMLRKEPVPCLGSPRLGLNLFYLSFHPSLLQAEIQILRRSDLRNI